MIDFVNTVIGGGSLFLAAGAVLLFSFSFAIPEPRLITLVRKHALLIVFGGVLLATAGSLFYSQVLGFAPCLLCWWQRIFMFSQVVILGIALFFEDYRALRSSLGLSLMGGSIALYQVFLERGVISAAPCPATGPTPSCADIVISLYGFLTIPLMSFIFFVFIALVAFMGIRYHREVR